MIIVRANKLHAQIDNSFFASSILSVYRIVYKKGRSFETRNIFFAIASVNIKKWRNYNISRIHSKRIRDT